MPIVQVNDGDLHYERDCFAGGWTHPETVLIQHGFGRNSRFWSGWVPYLADEYDVIRRDLRGHGGSSDPGPDYNWTVEALLQDVIGFLDRLEIPSVHYVGESIGAMTGLACAVRWPERFKSLTLVSMPLYMLPAEPGGERDNLAVGGRDRATALEELTVGQWAESLMKPGTFSGWEGPPERKAWLVSEWDRTPSHVAQALMRAVRGFDVRPMLENVSVPTLVLAPTASALQPLATQVEIYEEIPNAQIATIDGGGHEIYLDRAEECTSAYLRFLHSLPSTSEMTKG
jgi:pimeloyl-ACP methyl ester carboxylesterase